MRRLAIVGLVMLCPGAAFATSFEDLIGQGYEVKLASNSRGGFVGSLEVRHADETFIRRRRR